MAHLTRLVPTWLLFSTSLLAGSCGGDAAQQTADGPGPGSTATSSELLTLASSCEDATATLKEQLKSQIARAYAQGDTCAYTAVSGTLVGPTTGAGGFASSMPSTGGTASA